MVDKLLLLRLPYLRKSLSITICKNCLLHMGRTKKGTLPDSTIVVHRSRALHHNMGTAYAIEEARNLRRVQELETLLREYCLLQILLLRAAYLMRMLLAN